MSEEISHDRRCFLRNAAITFAAVGLGMIGAADAQSITAKTADMPTRKRGMNKSFSSLKQIDAGLLNVGYAEAGIADGPAVILCTAGPMIFTATSMSRLCWLHPAIG